MAKVIKIAKKSYNAITETDDRNLIFNSQRNHLKTSKSGSFTEVITSGSTNTKSVSHNFSFRPLALAYFRLTSDSNWLICAAATPDNIVTRYSAADWVNVGFYVNDTNVVFKLTNGTASSKTMEVKYEIFYEGE